MMLEVLAYTGVGAYMILDTLEAWIVGCKSKSRSRANAEDTDLHYRAAKLSEIVPSNAPDINDLY